MSPHLYALYQCIKFHYKAVVATLVVLKLPQGFVCTQILQGERKERECASVLLLVLQSCASLIEKEQFYFYAVDNH